MSPSRRPCRIGSRGTASIEAIIALPVFVILFVGLLFIRDLTGAKLAADQEARRCAWQYSANNCDGVPPGCGDVVARGNHGDIDGVVKKAIEEPQKTVKGGVEKILMGVVENALTQAFTTKVDANKVFDRRRPGLFGGGTRRVTGKYRLACNVTTQADEGFLKAAWHQFRPER